MRYAPPGLCLNDFDMLRHEDGSHTVLHLQGPWTRDFDHLRMETSYGSATSTDLVRWRPEASVFGVGLPGRFDEQAVWTMRVVPHGEGLAMFYTGVPGVTPGGWPLQAVGLAYSDRRDGTGWRRHGTGPVAEADPRWYRTEERMGWRDPFVVPDDESDGWIMVVCASDASLPVEVSGCVGLATSEDFEHWTVHPPLLSPGDVDEFECPVLERLDDGTWLLLGSIGSTRGFEAWTAPRLRGPWTRRGPLGPTGSYAPRITRAADGARVVLHTTPRRAGLTDAGAKGRGMLAQPKLLITPPDDSPRLAWWPGLDGWLGEETDRPLLHALADVEISGSVQIVLRTDRPVGTDESAAGLSDGSADTGSPAGVNSPAGNGGSAGKGGSPGGGSPAGTVPALAVTCEGTRLAVIGPDGSALAETALPAPPTTLRIMTVGEYVEVYADGVFSLTALCYSGHPAPWRAHQGGGSSRVPVRPVLLPDPERDDASAIWPGPAAR